MKIVFFGSSRYVVPILQMLKNNFGVSLVVTTEQGDMDAVPFFCKTEKVDFIRVRKPADLIENYPIMQQMPELGVVADFGLIIPEQTFKYFAYGMINVHPSLLPKYRGATPAQTAILNGDKKSGVSIIQLDNFMDHGAILSQEEEEIKPEDTAKTLYERLFKKGAVLLEKTIENFQMDNVKANPQNHDEATFTKILTRDDGLVDIRRYLENQEFFNRMVKAYYPWPGVWSEINLGGKDKKIVKFLPEHKIQVEGGREMTYKDFANGYSNADPVLLTFLKKNEES